MKKIKNIVSLGFTKEHLPESCHVCLIYEDEEQRKKIVSEYIKAGLQQGEVVRYFADKTTPESVRSWLIENEVEISAVEKNGSFGIVAAENAYCPEGRFDPNDMINRSIKRYDSAKDAGYKGSRACGEMSWALKGIPGSERFLEYEILLNNNYSNFPHTGMCQYDAHLFDGATLLKVLQVHPYIIAQGQVVQNPYYTKT
jgi:hypothetical protein